MKVYIRSRRTAFARDGHPALTVHPCGRLTANCFGTAQSWETWTMVCLDGNSIAFKSIHDKYLSAKPDGSVAVDSHDIGPHEKWIIDQGYDGFSSLKSHYDKYLVADDFFDCGKVVKADRYEVNEWEQWCIVNDPNALTDKGYTANLALNGTLIGIATLWRASEVAHSISTLRSGRW